MIPQATTLKHEKSIIHKYLHPTMDFIHNKLEGCCLALTLAVSTSKVRPCISIKMKLNK